MVEMMSNNYAKIVQDNLEELFENLPPGGILSRTTAVAFVDHNQVEKIGWDGFEGP